ncbi:MAG: hypothetical protein ABIG30_03030 [Candidatus Aenigmatarchaeota archaeon]
MDNKISLQNGDSRDSVVDRLFSLLQGRASIPALLCVYETEQHYRPFGGVLSYDGAGFHFNGFNGIMNFSCDPLAVYKKFLKVTFDRIKDFE